MKILVMDDDSSITMLLENMLKFYGHEVTRAEEGREALEKFKMAQKKRYSLRCNNS